MLSADRSARIQIRLLNALGKLLHRLSPTSVPALFYQKALRRFAALPETERSILLLCKGNICRSPYAEVQLRRQLDRYGLNRIQLKSAGLATSAGRKADPEALEVARGRGVDLDQHRTNSATAEDLNSAGLIVVMEPSQLLQSKRVLASGANKTILLGALSMPNGLAISIEDPYGKSRQQFEDCFDQLDAACENLAKALATSLR